MLLDAFIFQPDSYVPDPPPGVKQRWIVTQDGVRLHAWHAAGPEAVYDSERRRGVPAARIVCFGESLGGAVSIHLASTRPCAGVTVVSTFTCLRDVARHHVGPLAVLAGNQFDVLARIRDLAVPILVAHGDRDDIVPFELGRRLFATANRPKRFLRVAGAHHNDVFAGPGLIEAIAEFAHAVIAGAVSL